MKTILRKYDSWTKGRILRHIIYWFSWGFFYVTLNYLIKSYGTYWTWASFELIVLPIKISCAYLVAYYWMPKYLYSRSYNKFIPAVSLTFILFGLLLFATYLFIIQPYILQSPYKDYQIIEFAYKAVELVHITSLVVCIKFFQNILFKENQQSLLIQEKQAAELKFLKNQIQPHFLFNTLNNLYGMVLSKDEKAPKTIVKLSEMLGYMLYDSEVAAVPLLDEIEQLENYISLEKIRYDRKLKIEYHKSDIPANLGITPLILLPFIENAFKHGPANEEGISIINIDIGIIDNTFKMRIENSYNKEIKNTGIKSGIGLENVQKRLDIIYPGKHRLNIQEGTLYAVELVLELNKIPDAEA